MSNNLARVLNGFVRSFNADEREPIPGMLHVQVPDVEPSDLAVPFVESRFHDAAQSLAERWDVEDDFYAPRKELSAPVGLDQHVVLRNGPWWFRVMPVYEKDQGEKLVFTVMRLVQ